MRAHVVAQNQGVEDHSLLLIKTNQRPPPLKQAGRHHAATNVTVILKTRTFFWKVYLMSVHQQQVAKSDLKTRPYVRMPTKRESPCKLGACEW